MKEVDQDSFARLLGWLGPDADAAGGRYREIHRRLVRSFTCWGCSCPEELADRTLDRVASKLETVQDDYEGDPIAYVLGVARNVRREDYRSQSRARGRLQPRPPAAAPAE
ncbi:MAG TPA: hypothetical protein VF310_14645, partial [Vicinamibacteria bacterium]